jgi:hypothetical protein
MAAAAVVEDGLIRSAGCGAVTLMFPFAKAARVRRGGRRRLHQGNKSSADREQQQKFGG